MRGFAALQKDYGRFKWDHLVAPAEELARKGFRLSDGLMQHVEAALPSVQRSTALSALYLENGAPKAVGAIVKNPDLARTLDIVGAQGPDGFYKGIIAQKIVTYTEDESIGFDLEEFGAYEITRHPVQYIHMGKLTVTLPPQQLGSGAFASALLTKLSEVNSSQDIGAATRLTLDEFEVDSLPRDLGATGFAAVDTKGQAVSCAITMNGAFGAGHVASDTGVALARSPKASSTGFSSAFLSPVIATRDQGNLALVGVGSGGPNGTASLAYSLLIAAREGSMSQPEDVRTTGVAPFSTVNVIACLGADCAAISDPGTSGLGINQADDGSAGKRPRRGRIF